MLYFDYKTKKAITLVVERIEITRWLCFKLGKMCRLKRIEIVWYEESPRHVFMERLLPIALKEFHPSNVWIVLIELCLFHRDLCSPKISFAHISKLEAEIPIILCKFEKIFPSAFFDVMEHLIVHLPYEARVGGPVQYR